MPIKFESLLRQMTLERLLGLFVAVAIASVLMGTLFLVRLNADVNWDGVVFITAAKKFATGGFSEGFSAWPKFPAYPFLIFIVHYLIPDWVAAGRLISLVASILVVAGVYRITEDWFNAETALLSALVFSFLPETLLQSNAIYRDPAFLAAFIWSIYFFQKSLVSGKPLTLAAALFFLLLSCMFRAEGLCVLAVYIGTLLMSAYRNTISRRINLRFLLVCLCVSFIFALLTFVAFRNNSAYVTQLFDTFSGYNSSIFLDSYTRLSEQLQAINDGTPNSDVGVHFGIQAKRMIPIIFGLGILNIFASTLLFVNVILAIIGIKNTKWSISSKFVLASAIGLLVVLYLYFISYDLMLSRWVLPVVALICPWVGVGICKLLQPIKKLRYAQFLGAGLIMALAINSTIEFNKFFKTDDNLAIIAGTWIARQGYFDESNTVFNDPVVAFYAEMGLSFTGRDETPLYLKSDDKTFNLIEEFAKGKKSDFIVICVKKIRVNSMATFRDFVKIKEFDVGNKMVIIFCSLTKYRQVILQPEKSA